MAGLNNQKFTYQVKATDPENDTLFYSLKTAPSGMTIEKTTGLIKVDCAGRISRGRQRLLLLFLITTAEKRFRVLFLR